MSEPQRTERRSHLRYQVCFPVSFDATDRKGRIGVAHNAGVGGILLNTASRLAVGESVVLTLILPGDDYTERRVGAEVVRIHQVEEPSVLPWRYMAAMKFERHLVEIEDALRGASQGLA